MAGLFVWAFAPPALAGPKPSLNAYFQSNLEDTSYQKKTFDRVAAAWKAPGAKDYPKPKSKAVVQAVISRDGKLVSAVVSMSSGSKKWDESVLSAVKRAAPFDPLPARFGFPSVEVHFHLSLQP
jgi:protein TonB